MQLPVILESAGEPVSSLAHTFTFDPRYTPVRRHAEGGPDCVADARLAKPVRFAFWPAGCAYELETYDAARALMVDLSGQSGPVSSGPLYRCQVAIAANAPAGTYPVELHQVEAAARGGNDLQPVGTNGSMTVLDPPGGGGRKLAASHRDAFPWIPISGMLVFALIAFIRRSQTTERRRHGNVAADRGVVAVSVFLLAAA